VGAEAQAGALERARERGQPLLERRSLDAQTQLRDAPIEQLLVREGDPSGLAAAASAQGATSYRKRAMRSR
jgi:hypothetical protein